MISERYQTPLWLATARQSPALCPFFAEVGDCRRPRLRLGQKPPQGFVGNPSGVEVTRHGGRAQSGCQGLHEGGSGGRRRGLGSIRTRLISYRTPAQGRGVSLVGADGFGVLTLSDRRFLSGIVSSFRIRFPAPPPM